MVYCIYYDKMVTKYAGWLRQAEASNWLMQTFQLVPLNTNSSIQCRNITEVIKIQNQLVYGISIHDQIKRNIEIQNNVQLVPQLSVKSQSNELIESIIQENDEKGKIKLGAGRYNRGLCRYNI